MKEAVLTVALLVFCSTGFAANNWSQMTCRGSDTTGQPIYLTAQADSPSVTINGDNLLIVGKTNNGQGVVTENFVSTNGVLAYDSLVPVSRTGLDIYQFNAATQVLLARASLLCSFRGIKTRNHVASYAIFKTIKKTMIQTRGFLKA